jgi:hypothetical protein
LTALETASDRAATGVLTLDPVWGSILVVTLVVCLVARTIKHRTRLLHVEGR